MDTNEAKEWLGLDVSVQLITGQIYRGLVDRVTPEFIDLKKVTQFVEKDKPWQRHRSKLVIQLASIILMREWGVPHESTVVNNTVVNNTKALPAPSSKVEHPYADVLVPGDPVYIEFPKVCYIGRVNRLTPTGVWLTDAAVITACDLTPFLESMAKHPEVQTFPDPTWVNLAELRHVTTWRHALPYSLSVQAPVVAPAVTQKPKEESWTPLHGYPDGQD